MKRVVILLTLLAGCTTVEPTVPSAETRSVGGPGHADFMLTTISHDGHLFVVCSCGTGVSVVVHPDDGKVERSPE